MSVIVARKTATEVVVACDSQTTRGWMKERKHVGKAEQVGSSFIVGAVGLSEASALFRRYARTRKPERNDEAGICDYMIDFYDWGEPRTADLENLNKEAEYMIVLDGRIWTIHGHLVEEYPEYAAIGSGMGEARAAMMLGKSAREAVWVACQINLYCHEPVIELSAQIDGARSEAT